MNSFSQLLFYESAKRITESSPGGTGDHPSYSEARFSGDRIFRPLKRALNDYGGYTQGFVRFAHFTLGYFLPSASQLIERFLPWCELSLLTYCQQPLDQLAVNVDSLQKLTFRDALMFSMRIQNRAWPD